ncbi:MAG: MBL fold metallo-hydrolase [Peptococcaceae bacterium]|jgi:glyoxylase-like metal-dependent hydrolase (beta-lactamase superfamily II)|nr:MBL fold metallo-hydrolase [Peptococcaceae bacterium]
MACEAIRLSGDSWRIEDKGVRAFLFAGAEKALLVDTGFGNGDIKSVVDGLVQTPVMLVNTHADNDHIGGNKLFGTAFMHPSEFTYYSENAGKDAPVSPLWEGDIVDLGARKFEILHTPGHTNGSIALLDRANRILITGDTFSMGPVFLFGNMRSIRAYKATIDKLKPLKDAVDDIYPSHGAFPLGFDIIFRAEKAADKLIAGELKGADPPFEMPAKMYLDGGVGFFY